MTDPGNPERGDGRPHDHDHDDEGRDEFDDIVSRLDLDWDDPGLVDVPEPDPDPEPEPEPSIPPELDFDDMPDTEDEQFYRQVPQGSGRPLHRGRVAAWCGVLGTPLVMAVCTMLGVWLSGPLLLTAGLIVVASAIYLISQLPERGPSHPDWPDDGAAL